MARFFLDNNVSGRVFRLLTEDGHQVFTSRAEGLAARNDVEQLLAATDHGAVLVTHDREDFLLVHRAWHALMARWKQTEAHGGIAVVPQVGDAEVHRYLTECLETVPTPQNTCWRYRRVDGWVRH